jgi:hypothetical protein
MQSQALSRMRWGLGLVLGAAVLSLSAVAADLTINYDRIEEDWEFVVGEPDPTTNAPQLINVISPVRTLTEDYAVLELNHITQPDYVEGGLQLQMWGNDEYLSNYTPQPSRVLTASNETIQYTLVMTVESGQLKVRVKNGTSASWGSFGGDSFVVTKVAQRADLSDYTPTLSAAKSRVAYAKHRVERFALKRVRYYRNNILLKTDETLRQVYPPVS